MARFFTSDTHFGDTRILRSAKRPFRTIAEHDAHLMERWRATVRADDELWFLGDFAPNADAKTVGALLDQLPGRKHLITGNNDDAATRGHPGWESVQDYAELVEDERLCILCHYALRTWNKIGKGSLDLHGHSHAMLKPLTRQFDVGVDAWQYTPVTLATMLTARRQRLYPRRTLPPTPAKPPSTSSQ
jgi:calcineurin-like phosphoesterase family protein